MYNESAASSHLAESAVSTGDNEENLPSDENTYQPQTPVNEENGENSSDTVSNSGETPVTETIEPGCTTSGKSITKCSVCGEVLSKKICRLNDIRLKPLLWRQLVPKWKREVRL